MNQGAHFNVVPNEDEKRHCQQRDRLCGFSAACHALNRDRKQNADDQPEDEQWNDHGRAENGLRSGDDQNKQACKRGKKTRGSDAIVSVSTHPDGETGSGGYEQENHPAHGMSSGDFPQEEADKSHCGAGQRAHTDTRQNIFPVVRRFLRERTFVQMSSWKGVNMGGTVLTNVTYTHSSPATQDVISP